MTIFKKTVEELKRYTFIEDVVMKPPYIYFKYKTDGKIKTKRLAMRASSEQLQQAIIKIKKEVGFDEMKFSRDETIIKELKKPMMFVNSEDE